MPKTLIIVESAKKAKTIKGMLSRDYTIKATSGHILEMPSDEMHVDMTTFLPTLHLIRGKGKRLNELKGAATKADSVLLATDPDREGEAIAQHVVERLGRDIARRAQRIAFTAITERDVQAAVAAPRPIDQNLVEAQTARRVIDRLVGYSVSPVLWAGLTGVRRLSAGRVQSPALWLVVQRERLIRDFVSEEWWSVDAELSKRDAGEPENKNENEIAAQRFWARLYRVDGKKPSLKTAEDANKVKNMLESAAWRVASVKKAQRTRRPYPPFTTDTLQQAASSQLNMPPKTTMSMAQQLYEGMDVGEGKAVGLITYLRTDSVAVAPEAQQAAREIVTHYWGAEYLPPKPPTYATRDKTAQEAHEAIRPTDPARTPKQVEPYLNPQQYQLYRLIWRRFIASQMKPAVYDTVTVDVETLLNNEVTPYLFRAKGETLRFAGFLKVYGVDVDAEAARSKPKQDDDEAGPQNTMLPDLQNLDWLRLHQLVPKQHFTKPPARYTEAGLIGELKKRGLGRPSTYATIVETLKSRNYVEIVKKRMQPTPLGFQVCELLEAHIDLVVDVDFTARMEADLDAIARGQVSRLKTMTDFYEPFRAEVEKALAAARQNRQRAAATANQSGNGYRGKSSGKKSRRSKSTRKRSTKAKSNQNLPSSEKDGQTCPQCKEGTLTVRKSKYGPFLGCSRFREGCRYTEKILQK